MSKGLPRSLARGAGKSTVRKHQIKIKDLAVSVAGATGNGWGTAVAGDLPEGNILLLGAVGYFQASTADADVGATFNATVALGSAPTADATLGGAEVDILAATALGAATAGVSPMARLATAGAVILDNTDGSLELNVNMTIPDANIGGTGDMLVNGIVEIVYAVVLDD